MKHRLRKSLALTALLMAALLAIADAVQGANASRTETVVLVRHGEKPAAGLGQLSCQGLNRALALPAVIRKLFGKPAAIFAPDPARRKMDHGVSFDYVRPLATIEPTAIGFGLPVDTRFGFADIDSLRKVLDEPAYEDALVLVAWEHELAERIARELVTAHGGDAARVPEWKADDFDSVYVVKISRTNGTTTVSFELLHEGLDGQPATCRE